MFLWALASVDNITSVHVVFVALREHDEAFGLRSLLKEHVHRDYELVLLDRVTGGQLCTVLAARGSFSDHDELLIVSSDTYVVSNVNEDIVGRSAACRGMISTFDLPGDRWSFARTDERGRVVEVAEKVRISTQASTGMYYFTDSQEFFEVADEIIRNQEKTRGEYYVMPVYGKYIERGWLVTVCRAREMWDMGTPAAKVLFEQHLAKRVAGTDSL
jgi:dTDP-glucose pyrophosphorylase